MIKKQKQPLPSKNLGPVEEETVVVEQESSPVETETAVVEQETTDVQQKFGPVETETVVEQQTTDVRTRIRSCRNGNCCRTTNN